MLPPPTRMTFASPCFVFTRSIAASRAREISRRPDPLVSEEIEVSIPSFLKTRSVAYDVWVSGLFDE